MRQDIADNIVECDLIDMMKFPTLKFDTVFTSQYTIRSDEDSRNFSFSQFSIYASITVALLYQSIGSQNRELLSNQF